MIHTHDTHVWQLDLANKSERWIMQEVVHLAIAEPGVNCVNETYNDMDLPIPASWYQPYILNPES